MDSVLGRIRRHQDFFTTSESRVADYCLKHPERILTSSIHDVAVESGVSVASVSRMAATLGYANWKEMRLNLAKDSGADDNPVFPEIAREDSDEAVIHKVFNANVLCIQNTLRQLDRKKIFQVVKQIGKTGRIMFFGSGGSGFIARDEALRFSHLKPIAQACTEDYQMMLQAAKMRKGEIAFAFSNSGRSVATAKVLAEARKAGAMTVGIANFSNTPLEKASDFFFKTAFPAGGGITAALTARVGLLAIMDTIYVLSAHYGAISEKIGYLDEMLESNLRAPNRSKRKHRKT